MNKTIVFKALFLCTLLFAACQQAPESKPAVQETPKPDLAAIKAEIQAFNNTWAVASNAKDVATIMAFYADDAISMPDDKPALSGKTAIQQELETMFAEKKGNDPVTYETLEVYGNDNILTEIGKSTVKDAAGKVIYAGKYIVLWEKRNGKWLVIREIYNDDAKEK